jgi:hypothetical protein
MTLKIPLGVRQFFCSHACYIEDIRPSVLDEVECECHRCGKTLYASYGLALNAGLFQRADES